MTETCHEPLKSLEKPIAGGVAQRLEPTAHNDPRELNISRAYTPPRTSISQKHTSADVVAAIKVREHQTREILEARKTAAVYFIESQCLNGYIKIGLAVDPMKRMADMKICNPYPLKLIGVIEGAGPAVEKKLQERFAANRVTGEWFRPSQELLDLIAALRPTPTTQESDDE